MENREHIGEKRTGVALCPTHFSGVNQTFSQYARLYSPSVRGKAEAGRRSKSSFIWSRMSRSRMMFVKEHRQAVAHNIVGGDCRFEQLLLDGSWQIWPKSQSGLTEQLAELLIRFVHFILRSTRRDGGQFEGDLAQYGPHLRSSVIYLNLKHRIGRL